MKISLDWLGEHIDLTSYSAEDLDRLLTFSGIEVENIIMMPDKVIVAEIKTINPHANADKLSVCMVDDGTKDLRQIVCGAQNFKIGDKVPLAVPGAKLGNGFSIKQSKLRGTESHGMLCSQSELGGNDDQGLWILPTEFKIGTPLNTIYPTIFDLEITPNRPDCLSHLGIARELSALSDKKLKGNPDYTLSKTPQRIADKSEANILSPEKCSLYTTRIIRNVQVTESPHWLKTKIESIGLRSINNIVDITNYVMMEMGQPLHAFDFNTLEGGICVRPAKEGEKFTALDGLNYNLSTDDLVIADENKAIAIAGIMGGADTGITEKSQDVLLEAAYFLSPSIRKSSRSLGLSTDSSYRFERGVDPSQVIGSSELATKLILELAGGKADKETLISNAYEDSLPSISLDPDKCRSVLGHNLKDQEMIEILEGLRLRKIEIRDNISDWEIPSYRRDLTRTADLHEEIARVYGIDNIPSLHAGWFAKSSEADHFFDFIENNSNELSSIGFYETRTIKLTSKLKIDDCVCTDNLNAIAIKNPLSDDLTHMRPGLIASLIDVAERNLHQGAEGLRFFETGTVFPGKETSEEAQHLAILISGPEQSSWIHPSPTPAGFFTLKGILERIIDKPIEFILADIKQENAAFIVNIAIDNKVIGRAAQIAPSRARQIDARHPIFVAELNLDLVFAERSQQVIYQELPKYPSIRRDIAMELPFSLPNREIEKVLREIDSSLLESFKLFDLFYDETGNRMDKNKKSIAYSLTYRNDARTLKSAEVDTEHEKILSELRTKLPIEFR